MSDSLDSTPEQLSSPRRLLWFVAIAGLGFLVATPFRRSTEEAVEIAASQQELASTRFARASDFRGPASLDSADSSIAALRWRTTSRQEGSLIKPSSEAT